MWITWVLLGAATGVVAVIISDLALGRTTTPGELAMLHLGAAAALLVVWLERRRVLRGMVEAMERRDRAFGRARVALGPEGVRVEDGSGFSELAWRWVEDVPRIPGGLGPIGGSAALPIARDARPHGDRPGRARGPDRRVAGADRMTPPPTPRPNTARPSAGPRPHAPEAIAGGWGAPGPGCGASGSSGATVVRP